MYCSLLEQVNMSDMFIKVDTGNGTIQQTKCGWTPVIEERSTSASFE